MLTLTPRNSLLLIFAVMLAGITGAWIYEYLGYIPCELCLKQRWAYYVVVPLSLLIYVLSASHPKILKPGLWLLALILLASAAFGIYHAGIEWKWWPGPSTCTGTLPLSGLPDLTKKITLCDQASLRIFGLSLAGWNAVISGALAGLALWAARKA